MTKKLSHVTKVESDMMLIPFNVIIEPSNLRKKIKELLYVTKKTVKCDIETAQFYNETIKCEEKKKKGTTECDKRTVICDKSGVRCDVNIV